MLGQENASLACLLRASPVKEFIHSLLKYSRNPFFTYLKLLPLIGLLPDGSLGILFCLFK